MCIFIYINFKRQIKYNNYNDYVIMYNAEAFATSLLSCKSL